MNSIDAIMEGLGFTKTYHVLGRASVADLFRPGKRCGIYILHFANGEYYCGQSVDVARRYVEHSKTHSDIEKISFKRVQKKQLNVEELQGIHSLEAEGLHLRNISLTSIPYGPSDLDMIMSEETQKEWLEDTSFLDHSGTRPISPELRRKYNSRFKKFSQLPQAEEVIKFLQTYAYYCIPAVRRTEISFWSCTCLPNKSVLSRVNIFWQEVLTIGVHNGVIFYSFHTAKSPLTEKKFSKFLLKISHPVQIFDHKYKPGGQDQVKLYIEGTKKALSLVEHRTVLQAIRVFNMRLMQKGACIYNRYHCLDLADQFVPPSPI